MTITKENGIDWSSVIFRCVYSRKRSILDFFPVASFSEAMLQATSQEEEMRVFSEDDLDEVRKQRFMPRGELDDEENIFQLFLQAITDIVEQLYDGPARDWYCTYDIFSPGYFIVRFFVRDWIGSHEYDVMVHRYEDAFINVSTWDDFLNAAHKFALTAVKKLNEWNHDRPDGEEA